MDRLIAYLVAGIPTAVVFGLVSLRVSLFISGIAWLVSALILGEILYRLLAVKQ